jgi:NAD-dependent SIR2 family protein deacetylase
MKLTYYREEKTNITANKQNFDQLNKSMSDSGWSLVAINGKGLDGRCLKCFKKVPQEEGSNVDGVFCCNACLNNEEKPVVNNDEYDPDQLIFPQVDKLIAPQTESV